MRRIAACLLLLSVLSLTACFKTENRVYVLPDGSGKLDVRATYGAILSDMVAQADSVGEDMAPMPAFELEQALKYGIAAYIQPENHMPPAKGTEGTLYFDDITKLKFSDSEDPDSPSSAIQYVLSHDGMSHSLTVVDTMLALIAEIVSTTSEDDVADEEFQSLVDGMGIGYTFTVPGRIVSAEGFQTVEGRTAKYAIDQAGIIDAIRDPAKRASVPRRLSVTWSSSEMPEKEIAGFRKEMTEAKRKFSESARK